MKRGEGGFDICHPRGLFWMENSNYPGLLGVKGHKASEPSTNLDVHASRKKKIKKTKTKAIFT